MTMQTTVPTAPELEPGLRLLIPAMPENVALARQVIAGVSDALDVEAGRSADMKIAVTEAVTNSVVHAYPHGTGLAELAFTTLPEYVVVSVRDRGVGFKPTAPTVAPVREDDGLGTGYGLALIGTLSDEFAVMSGASGTEVQMLFALGEQPPADGPRIFSSTSQLAASAALDGERSADPELVTLELSPTEPVTPVLGRFVSLLAARAGFSIDRLSDAQLVSDALARHAPGRLANGALSVLVSEGDGDFSLSVGTLGPDGGRGLLDAASLPGIGSLLEQLSDEITVEPDGDGERVRLRLARR